MKNKTFLKRLAAIVVCLSCMGSASQLLAQAYELKTVAEGFDFPWSIDFATNGDRFVVELAGDLRVVNAKGEVSDPIQGVPEVFRASQGGLFDVLLHPQFAQNNTLYLSYAAGDVESNATTVARATFDGAKLNNVEVIFSVSPQKYAPLHYGGRLAWMTDGTLLLTTGDGFDFREKAQDISNQMGKTIRMNADGSAPADNPIADSPYVYSYGHRNPQGLVVSANGTIYQHEHGPAGGDEINIIQPGHNYGWPAITHGMDYNGAYVSPFKELAGMTQPIHTWVPSIAPSGFMINEGDVFPEWQGSLFVGALVDMEVRRVALNGDQVASEEPLFAELEARIRDLRQAPEWQYLYFDRWRRWQGDSGRADWLIAS